MTTSAETYSSTLQRPKGRLSVEAQAQSPLSVWYGDLSGHSRTVMSPLDMLQLRSAAVYAQPEHYTPRRVSPIFAVRSARTAAEGSISPRHAVIARRRYQVMTTDCSSLSQQGTPLRVQTPHNRPYSSPFVRGCTAVSSPVQKKGIMSTTGVGVTETFSQTQLFALPSSPRLHSAFTLCPQQLEQDMRHTTPVQKLREHRRNDESLVTSSNDLSNTDDGCSTQVNTSNPRPHLGSRTPRSGLSQIRKDARPETSRVFSPVLSETIPQQSVQKVAIPAARRFQMTDFYETLRVSQTVERSSRDSLRQDDLNSTLGRELPVYDRLCGKPGRKTATGGAPLSRVPTSLYSAPVRRSLMGNSVTKPSPSKTTTTQGSATAGTTPGPSDGGSQSSTEAHNLTVYSYPEVSPISQSSLSFASCRSLIRQFVQRWRNRYEENKNAYCEGGYMAVTPGKKLNSRYVVVHKLGWGEFSTVWLAYDTMHKTLGKAHQAFVALKIAKCDNSVSASTQYEINLLRYMGMQSSSGAPLTSLVDCFEVNGQYGSHICMVMPLHGSNLLSIIDQMKAKKCVRSAQEIRLVKEIVASILLGLQELDRMDIIHTDIKPENILCIAPDPKVLEVIETFCRRNKDRSTMVPYETLQGSISQGNPNHLVCLADFGLSVALKSSSALTASRGAKSCQTLLSGLIGRKKEFLVEKPGVVTNLRGTMIQTREYRAPEILIGLDFTTRTDLWSVGCMVFELITGDFLMDPKRRTKNERMMDVEHLAMMMQLLGPVPDEIIQLRTAENLKRPPPRYIHRYFNEHGRFIYADKYRFYQKRHLDKELESFLPSAEAKGASAFIMRCLSSYDPAKRPSVSELFNDEWLLEVMGQRVC